jgi:hypothetical protein
VLTFALLSSGYMQAYPKLSDLNNTGSRKALQEALERHNEAYKILAPHIGGIKVITHSQYVGNGRTVYFHETHYPSDQAESTAFYYKECFQKLSSLMSANAAGDSFLIGLITGICSKTFKTEKYIDPNHLFGATALGALICIWT